METTQLITQEFLTIKEAAQQFTRSEQTIRRLVKQHSETSHVRVEKTPKGNAYLVSRAFLVEQYSDSDVEQPPVIAVVAADSGEVLQLREALAKREAELAARDQTIQQLQHRLLEQNDVLNALTNQVNSQKISHVEELLLKQNEQLVELQKRLPDPNVASEQVTIPEPIKRGFWQRLFSK